MKDDRPDPPGFASDADVARHAFPSLRRGGHAVPQECPGLAGVREDLRAFAAQVISLIAVGAASGVRAPADHSRLDLGGVVATVGARRVRSAVNLSDAS
jgi:hypothetical protein